MQLPLCRQLGVCDRLLRISKEVTTFLLTLNVDVEALGNIEWSTILCGVLINKIVINLTTAIEGMVENV
eukprot:8216141-Ditylum_brightwellii.AAC.1